MTTLMGPLRDFNDFAPGYSQYPLTLSSDRDARHWNNDTLHMSTKSRTSSGIPLDAPTQERKYLLPSATSRKVIPARFAKQAKAAGSHSRGSSIEDELDEAREESPPLDPNLVEQITDRRRRNAISARNSRRRRVQQLEDLEKERDDLLRLVHDYRDHILTLHTILKSNHIPFSEPPFFRPRSSMGQNFD